MFSFISSFFDFVSLNDLTPAEKAVSFTGLTFNFLAVVFLLSALIPPFLDTRKSRKTFGISTRFFYFYISGGVAMFINAIINLIGQITGPKLPALIILFIVFVILNTISVSMNLYMLKIKLQNMKNAEKNSMNEQEYWEKFLNVKTESSEINS